MNTLLILRMRAFACCAGLVCAWNVVSAEGASSPGVSLEDSSDLVQVQVQSSEVLDSATLHEKEGKTARAEEKAGAAVEHLSLKASDVLSDDGWATFEEGIDFRTVANIIDWAWTLFVIVVLCLLCRWALSSRSEDSGEIRPARFGMAASAGKSESEQGATSAQAVEGANAESEDAGGASGQTDEGASAAKKDESATSDEVARSEAESQSPPKPFCTRTTCCTCCVVDVLLLYVIVCYLVGRYATGPAFFGLQLDIVDGSCKPPVSPKAIGAAQNWSSHIWWPGCQTTQLVSNMELFTSTVEDHLVTYPSRNQDGHETVTLSGWVMLPEAKRMDRGNVPPRIVVQHGFRGNANKIRPQVAAFMLRSLGFTVIVNNLRDRCGSGYSSYRKVAWGYDYPYDVLGAWDYAVKDPDNLMGGEVSPDKVAVYGQSMGAFSVLTAFGIEGQIPGAFMDSMPLSPSKAALPGAALVWSTWGLPYSQAAAYAVLPGEWSPMWRGATQWLGVDPSLNVPLETLPTGPDTHRAIGLASHKKDADVWFSSSKQLMRLVSGPLATKYSVTDVLFTETDCERGGGRKPETHVVAMLTNPNVYRSTLCSFFCRAFKMDVSYCALEGLPDLS